MTADTNVANCTGADPTDGDSTGADSTGYDSTGADCTDADSIGDDSTGSCVNSPKISTSSKKNTDISARSAAFCTSVPDLG